MIVGLIGHPSSGKRTFAKYLEHKYQFVAVDFREFKLPKLLAEPTSDQT